ncbi:carboxypeptidase-like regulatory domain-containing protein [Robertkochia sediminum]|uniref:carboxypeptidase-like regulatory domain-containing protein n=1 Tax=Robertkochia sediminum TaxID=2785326 RepID=UPI001932998B|nr:carboxypeptidase-like regulatory domain-containing protein [Robertkochia sediminum]MBL7472906.1 carboxypeptidase-like regulatory domain-containing protein [Robertkochia sediminum]
MNKFLCLIAFFFSLGISAQNAQVYGKITNSNGDKLQGISVLLFHNKAINSFGYSNVDGRYSLLPKNVKQNDTLQLKITALGYKSIVKEIVLDLAKANEYNFELVEDIQQLNEVVLEGQQKIIIKRDTIVFNADSYKDGNEQVIEDLLAKLPGVEVESNGEIKVHGKFIDKLLIEGDDLFDNKYKILSKNLDASHVSAVEILDNFEDNPVLKSFKESDKVAINLKLNDEKKNVWFGNINLGLGNNERYSNRGNIGLLRKKIKIFNLSHLNNIGELTVPQTSEITAASGSSNLSDKNFRKENQLIVDIDEVSQSQLSKNEDVFNNSFLNSFSIVGKLNKNLTLRSMINISKDQQDKWYQISGSYIGALDSISFYERKYLELNDDVVNAEVEVKYLGNSKTYYVYRADLNFQPSERYGEMDLNGENIVQNVEGQNFRFYNQLDISKKLSQNKLLFINGYWGSNEVDQKLSLRPNLFDQNSNTQNDGNGKQAINAPQKYGGVNSELFMKFEHSEATVRVEGFAEDKKITSEYFVGDNQMVDSLSGNFRYENNGYKITTKYHYDLSSSWKFKSFLKYSMNELRSDLSIENFSFLSPSISIGYKSKSTGVFNFNYVYYNQLPGSFQINSNYLLRNYRTLVRGSNTIADSKNHNFSIRYAYKNYKNLLFINSSLSYGLSDKRYSFNSFVNENIIFNQYELLEGGKMVNGNFAISTYLNFIPFSVKISSDQFWNTMGVMINNEGGILENYNALYTIQGTSYFNIPLNFKFQLQYNYSKGYFNDQQSENGYYQGFLNALVELNDWIKIDVNNNFYTLNSDYYLFSDVIFNLNPKKGNWSYRISGKNLANRGQFANIVINEFQTTESSIPILPRYFLAEVKYRF